MNLRVGPFVYRVRFVEELIEHEGRRCLGLCDNDAHVILVARHGSEAQQVQVVCHEYMEAWVYHFGQGMTDKEAMCDLFGMAMTQFTLDLMHQMRCWADPSPAGDASATNGDDLSLAGDDTQAMASAPGRPLGEHGSLAEESAEYTQRYKDVFDRNTRPETEHGHGPGASVGLKQLGRWSVRGLGQEGGWRIRLVEPSGETGAVRRVS
ncbi:MAG: hypothetical protein IT442_01025 [Phycisphaeraceae bacterium]|nr:hypothetical protein [Phycisphaeraceae bacterium]